MPLPQHVAIIMDGNGRWAEQHGLPRVEGHRRGADSVRTITRAARRAGLKKLTLYAFSTQNWGRPAQEVQALMELLRNYLLSERSEILDNNIRLTTVGNTSRLPQFVLEPLNELSTVSADNQGMELCLALSYGSREEMLGAIQELARRVADGDLEANQISEKHMDELLSATEPELLIRTSGEQRLSNFLLWQAAYSELYFTDIMWPDFGEQEFQAALSAFAVRDRRFGLIDTV
ncbi:MAG TPA: di-trans,poly-cis-decaprenylcistransferase [Myxococcales bacterium]|nr:di-trans,poly-cis-decaprenylcistransferase [Myxococcales bacterium]HIN86720.1 di-trans,poly-cis-decaprenylcistransferase [Myxococcales bacterium]